MGAHVHKMVSTDEASMSGVCLACGQVKVIRKKQANGYYSLRCANAIKEQRHDRGKHGVRVAEAKRITGALPCEICGTEDRERYLDHDHVTGAIRGALCHYCNVGLGWLNDDLNTLTKAFLYLHKHENRKNAPWVEVIGPERKKGSERGLRRGP